MKDSNHVTMPRQLFIALAAVTALAVGGCGADSDAPDDKATETDTPDPSETPAGGTPGGLRQLWSQDLDHVEGVAGGFAVITPAGELTVLDAADGATRWSTPLPREDDGGTVFISASPDGTALYLAQAAEGGPSVAGVVPTVSAYDTAAGDQLWSVEVPDALATETKPVDASNGLIAAYGAVLSPEDGAILAEPGGLGDDAAFPVSSTALIRTDGLSSILGESPAGDRLWDETDLELAAACDPDMDITVIGAFGGVVVTTCFATNGTDVTVLFTDPTTGELIGEAPGDAMQSQPISEGVHDPATGISVIGGDAGQFGVNVASGEVVWTAEPGTVSSFGPVADGRLYATGGVLDVATGEVVESGDWAEALAATDGPYVMYLADDSTINTGLVYGAE
ncbi:PQQ-binding-like beta-propeller repeat protein [Stackebrandtia endophytica]|nr:PQQ-binding-like beta-propeller repeat protein [Stackebrandtia endophytica]